MRYKQAVNISENIPEDNNESDLASKILIKLVNVEKFYTQDGL